MASLRGCCESHQQLMNSSVHINHSTSIRLAISPTTQQPIDATNDVERVAFSDPLAPPRATTRKGNRAGDEWADDDDAGPPPAS